MKSWRTTTGGVLAALAVILQEVADLIDGSDATTFDAQIVFAAVMGAVALFTARDDQVTSEDAGAKPVPDGTDVVG